MAKKINQELLNEEVRRMKMLTEYSFYVGEDNIRDYDDTDNLILGEEGEEDELDPSLDNQEAPVDGEEEIDVDSLGGEELDLPDTDTADIEEPEMGADDLGDEELGSDELGSDEFGGDELDNGGDDVEIDVTALVKGSEEAKASADQANQSISALMGKFDELMSKVSSMDSITSKIDNLENELEKRTPTPEEKLEMRSFDSYPYNLKLTDFWANKEGKYAVMGNNNEKIAGTPEEEKEYILRQKDIDDNFNSREIQQSFDTDEYEEEDY
jgi:hypothetical protein